MFDVRESEEGTMAQSNYETAKYYMYALPWYLSLSNDRAVFIGTTDQSDLSYISYVQK